MLKRNFCTNIEYMNIILLTIFNIGLHISFIIRAIRQDIQLIVFANKILWYCDFCYEITHLLSPTRSEATWEASSNSDDYRQKVSRSGEICARRR